MIIMTMIVIIVVITIIIIIKWKAWTGAVKDATGRKGKGLFLPLRQALTGVDHGPEMKHMLPLIGPERTKARLRGEAA